VNEKESPVFEIIESIHPNAPLLFPDTVWGSRLPGIGISFPPDPQNIPKIPTSWPEI
jgi:hypothetical protein